MTEAMFRQMMLQAFFSGARHRIESEMKGESTGSDAISKMFYRWWSEKEYSKLYNSIVDSIDKDIEMRREVDEDALRRETREWNNYHKS